MISKAKIFDHGVAWEAGNSVNQGYQVNNTIYISGQFSHDQDAFVDGDVEAQTRLTLENLDRVLAGFGVKKSNLAYIEIYLIKPQEHFEASVRVFKEYLAGQSAGRHTDRRNLAGIASAIGRNQRHSSHLTEDSVANWWPSFSGAMTAFGPFETSLFDLTMSGSHHLRGKPTLMTRADIRVRTVGLNLYNWICWSHVNRLQCSDRGIAWAQRHDTGKPSCEITRRVPSAAEARRPRRSSIARHARCSSIASGPKASSFPPVRRATRAAATMIS